MTKKLAILPVLSLFLMPLQPAFAMTSAPDTSALFANLASVESVDFSADVDFETYNDAMPSPLTVHADVDGAWEGDHGFVDLAYDLEDQYGYEDAFNASVIIVDDFLYFTDNGIDWYSLAIETESSGMTQEDIETATNDMNAFMNELFEAGVIEYNLETFEYMNGALYARYAYELNTNALLDYAVVKEYMTSEEAAEAKPFWEENVNVYGYLWVDVIEVLPGQFTLNVDVDSETSQSTFALSVVMNSYSESVDVSAPENAVDVFDHYQGSDAENIVMTTVEKTANVLDTDGDGLTDEAELIWGSNPVMPDTDGDGYNDYTEVVHGYNPNGSGVLDTDGDGLTDYKEMTVHWSDPYDADTDGDGYADGVEIANGYDPNGLGRW